jgi:DNA-binding CsgD family transcriptional regulator
MLATLDLVADSGELAAGHVVTEGAIFAASGLGVGLLVRRLRAARRAERAAQAGLESLNVRLSITHAEAERWRDEVKELLHGLGVAIDRQLQRWHLTAAETQVALLLLKGLSHKEVAVVRGVGEATVRQQSRAIYDKAGVAGRHELAAFFLEGLLAPPGAASGSP